MACPVGETKSQFAPSAMCMGRLAKDSWCRLSMKDSESTQSKARRCTLVWGMRLAPCSVSREVGNGRDPWDLS